MARAKSHVGALGSSATSGGSRVARRGRTGRLQPSCANLADKTRLTKVKARARCPVASRPQDMAPLPPPRRSLSSVAHRRPQRPRRVITLCPSRIPTLEAAACCAILAAAAQIAITCSKEVQTNLIIASFGMRAACAPAASLGGAQRHQAMWLRSRAC